MPLANTSPISVVVQVVSLALELHESAKDWAQASAIESTQASLQSSPQPFVQPSKKFSEADAQH